jgi:hypothetical protein
MTAEEDDRCESLNAESSPHFRPETWKEIVRLNISPKRPPRITGHLFFDASPEPCRPNKRHSPNRFTSWEIHPVYNIEVCQFKSTSSCPLNGGFRSMNGSARMSTGRAVNQREPDIAAPNEHCTTRSGPLRVNPEQPDG